MRDDNYHKNVHRQKLVTNVVPYNTHLFFRVLSFQYISAVSKK